MNTILILSIATMAGLVLVDVACYLGLRRIAARRLSNVRRAQA